MVELKLSGIHKRFGATVALAGVSLEIRGGEVHALLGENGAGKSTLMKVLSGAVEPDSGQMALDGVPYRPRNPKEARSLGVSMIYQELSLCRNLTVAENIALGDEPGQLGVLARGRMTEVARAALTAIGNSDLNPNLRVQSLPISAQQLVEIAKAAASGARIFVFDEPTSSLTQADVRKLFTLIAGLKAQGHAIVYISHFLEEVTEIADRYTVLRDGQTVYTGQVAGVTIETMIAQMVGRDLTALYPRSEHVAGEVLLEVNNEHARLEIRRGEVVGLAGLVGSGRTEFLRTIFGLDEPVGGVRFKNVSGDYTPAQRWKQGMGLLSENRKEEGLALGLPIAENLTLTKPLRPRARTALARQWMERLFIRAREPAQKVGELSGGNQQKVALARLLYHGVQLYLLDEPTRGIDVGSKAEIYKCIDKLAGEGNAVIIVSSYLPELLGVCDRIAVMRRGKLGVARPARDWTEQQLLTEAIG